MPLADVTAEGVRAAIAEFDRLSRDAFLRSTGCARGWNVAATIYTIDSAILRPAR
jgi:hypothetical protein